jgi:tetratricopeptide (TPR) repeat protein
MNKNNLAGLVITLLTCHSCLVVPVASNKTDPTSQTPATKGKTCYPETFEPSKVSKTSENSSQLETTADKLAATGQHKEAVQKYIEAGEALANEMEADGRMADLEISAMFRGGSFQEENRAVFQKQAESNFKIGRSYTQLGEWESAIDCFDRTLNIGILPPNDAIAYLNRGDAYEKMGVKDKAKADFQLAANLFEKYKLPSYQKVAESRLQATK